jgi:hypothetical protein
MYGMLLQAVFRDPPNPLVFWLPGSGSRNFLHGSRSGTQVFISDNDIVAFNLFSSFFNFLKIQYAAMKVLWPNTRCQCSSYLGRLVDLYCTVCALCLAVVVVCSVTMRLLVDSVFLDGSRAVTRRDSGGSVLGPDYTVPVPGSVKRILTVALTSDPVNPLIFLAMIIIPV